MHGCPPALRSATAPRPMPAIHASVSFPHDGRNLHQSSQRPGSPPPLKIKVAPNRPDERTDRSWTEIRISPHHPIDGRQSTAARVKGRRSDHSGSKARNPGVSQEDFGVTNGKFDDNARFSAETDGTFQNCGGKESNFAPIRPHSCPCGSPDLVRPAAAQTRVTVSRPESVAIFLI